MANLNPLELERLKSLLSGKTLTMGEKISTLDILRSRFPRFFSNLEPGLTEQNLKDTNFLIKYLTNPYNRNKIKNALRKELSLSPTQQIELEESLTESAATTESTVTEAVSNQPAGQETATSNQSTATSAPVDGMPGIPSAPSITLPRVFVARQTPPPSGGMEGGPGQGTAATAKGNRLAAEKAQAQTQEQLGTTTPLPTTPASRGINFSAFRPSASFVNIAKNFGSKAGVFFQRNVGKFLTGDRAINLLGKAGTGGLNALSGITNFGGGGGGVFSSLGRLGRGNRGGGIFGRFNRFGGGGGPGGFSVGKATKGRGGLMFLLAILGFMMLVGILAITGTTPSGEATPITGSTDLSTCLFTRSDQTPKSASFKSPILLGYFQEASIKSGVPAPVLAGIARIESPGIVNYTDATLPSFPCETSETGAKGLMQVQPPGTTGYSEAGVNLGAKYLGIAVDQLDFCNLRQNIYLGAGVISAKVGGSWDPNKTNDPGYINTVAEGYYGCLKYGAPSGSLCSDPRNIFSYGDDLYAGVSQCKPSSGIIPPPPVGGDYAGWVKTNFNIDVSALPASYQQWAYEILSTSAKADIAPKFRNLISRSLTKVVLTPGDEGSHTSGDTVYIRPGYDVNFFKQIFIHELGHRIKGTAGTTSPQCNGQTIEQTETEGYLTYYAEHATPAQVRTPACGDNDQITRSDEDFGESVSYYINNGMGELNYGSACSTYNSINPYTRGDRPAHKAYIQCLLGP